MATYTGIKAILEQFKTRMIKTKVNNAAQADNATNATHATKADSATTATSATNATNATNADKLDGYHASNSSYPCLVPVTACSLGSTSGYIKLGNGLIVQWGKVTTQSNYGEFTFPLAFSNRNYFAQITQSQSKCETATARIDTGGWDHSVSIDLKYTNKICVTIQEVALLFVLAIGY